MKKGMGWWVTALLLSGCTYASQGVIVDEDRYAEVAPKDFFGDSTEKIVYLEQNWDRYDSLWFYNATQGSNLLPYDIFLHLEQPSSEALFRAPENMRRLRFLTQRESWDNPDGLPVGFAKDSYDGNDYLGFTCAACHTTQINYKGTGIRIDGGGSLADMEGLLLELETALQSTLEKKEKFDRLAKGVLGDADDAGKDNLRKTLQTLFDGHKAYNDSNVPLHKDNQVVHYGYGRLDAFGRIYNQILSHLTPGQANANPSNAPVSYPFLWDIPQHDFVQWNGIAGNNSDNLVGFFGPLGRNVGEVLGVFATFNLKKEGIELGYRSSADRRNLNRLEEHLTYLQSPVWPEDILPKIDPSLAKAGQNVFLEYRCHLCHESQQPDNKPFDRTNPKRRVIAQFASTKMIGTDPFMANNGIDLKGKSGFFTGKHESPDRKSDKFKEETPVFPALSRAVTYVIIEPDHDKGLLWRGGEWVYDLAVSAFSNPVKRVDEKHVDFETYKVGEKEEKNMELLRAYKARTLNGIWATAPYLHNGSVPNLYELFLPRCSDEEIATGKECRSNYFTVGSREFDPEHVGLVSKSKSEHPALYEFNTSLPSNSNAGHEYASGKTGIIKRNPDGSPIRDANGQFEMEFLPPMDHAKRIALVEYLKTL